MDTCGTPATTPSGTRTHGPLSGADVLESLPDAALVFDGDDVIVMANRACAGLLGAADGDVVGRPFWDFLPPALRRSHRERRSDALRDPTPWPAGRSSVVIAQRSDGSEVTLEFTVTQIVTAAGPDQAARLVLLREVAPAAGTMGGAGHLARAERAARIGSWERDGRSGEMTWSAGLYDLLGLPPGSVTPSPEAFLARVHPADRARLLRRQSETRARGGEFFVETRLGPLSPPTAQPEAVPDDAAWVPVTILGRVELDERGDVRFSAGTVQDASAYLADTRRLHVSNARLQHALDAAPDGLSLIDARPGEPARRILANRALGEILGLSDDAMMSTPILDSIDVRDRAAVGQALAALRSGETDHVRLLQARIVRPDGQQRWVNAGGALVRDAQGAPDYVVATLVDVTELVRAEEGTRAAQQVLASALDASPDGFAVFRILRSGTAPDAAGPRFRLTLINAAGAAMSRREESLVGLTLEEIVDDPEGSGVAGLLRRAVAHRGPQRLRAAYSSKGWTGVVDIVAVRVDDDHVLSTWRDVSAQVASENVLIEAYGRAQNAWDTLHLALDAASDAVLVLEVAPDGPSTGTTGPAVVIRYLNPVAAAATGRDRDELFDADLDASFPVWRRTSMPTLIREVAATGLPRTCRTVVDGPQGPHAAPAVAFEATISPLTGHRVIVISRDVTAQEVVNRQLEERRRIAERTAAHDPLTDLPNRAGLEQRLRHALMTCSPDERVAVLFCDVDDLKAVNDTRGHRAGDLLLRAVAARLRTCVAADQTAARISGDEFVLVLPGLDAAWQPGGTVDLVRRTVQVPVDLDGRALTPSLTVGCYVADPAGTVSDRDPVDVLAAADKVMYDAKNARRRGR